MISSLYYAHVTYLCRRPRFRRIKYPMAIIIIVGITITRICCVVIFLSCLLKRIFYYVHFVNISSLWNVLVLRKNRIISTIKAAPEIIQIVVVLSIIAPTSVAT